MTSDRHPCDPSRSEANVDINAIPDNPYLLLTPGPLSTTKSVKAAMLRDWCTWDDEYHSIVQDLRAKLVRLATPADGYTAVLMQGSGTFSVEATIGTALPADGRLLVLANGAYGERMIEIAHRLRIGVVCHDSGEMHPPDLDRLERTLAAEPGITHVAIVHCETTTGMLNPVEAVGRIVKSFGRTYLVDAMSSFGGIPFDIAEFGADFVISSSNKCIQGVPGFGFVIAGRRALEQTKGRARSVSLDLYEQWREMETKGGKWRFTSPTHVVRAFAQAVKELEEEGGVTARYARYHGNHRILVDGMRALGFSCLLPDEYQSPIITSFLSPIHPGYRFERFYADLKARGFVVYPGKVTSLNTFRIGNIGDVHPDDMRRLIEAVRGSMFWHEGQSPAETATWAWR
jgi:2-aminoethylphosphonate-pyruvate transaminase